MKKARSKRKELIMVAVVSTLSIGLFSASSLGINQFTFAAATNRAEPLSNVVEYDYSTLDIQSELDAEETEKAADTDLDVYEKESDFFYEDASDLDILEESNFLYEDTSDNTVHQPIVDLDTEIIQSPTLELEIQEHQDSMPTSTMSRAEVTQIGTRYISDMFGTSFEGLYISMDYYDGTSWWEGIVSSSEFEYRFVINGITGQRVSLTRRPLPFHSSTEEQLQEASNALEAIGWRQNNMPIHSKVAFDGVSSQVYRHKQAAREYAVQHFKPSTVTDFHLTNLADAYVNAAGDVIVQCFIFGAIDDTGREAYIIMYSEESPRSGYVTVTSWHYDIWNW